MEIVEVLEIIDSGQKTGRWRLTSRSNGNKPHGLCTHVHNSYDEAWNCVEAWQAAKKPFGDSG
ncbi:hypothetical protein [Nostoc sp. 'Lobaria pulmonaria (5183) cyanobiont']|uniref:hypothetical protein n=1 Tax=Nostoc sp. 'Lobaria pulmonaria (5183) cyanobiont' TaxID=1618022 RepID=UPI000CF30420|nr:hypothetical protein [Nostoc sp. 'Lobaria pulmonaria (5183) cyanobiont']